MKMAYLTLLAKNDKRSIISRNIQFICITVNEKDADVIQVHKGYVYQMGTF